MCNCACHKPRKEITYYHYVDRAGDLEVSTLYREGGDWPTPPQILIRDPEKEMGFGRVQATLDYVEGRRISALPQIAYHTHQYVCSLVAQGIIPRERNDQGTYDYDD